MGMGGSFKYGGLSVAETAGLHHTLPPLPLPLQERNLAWRAGLTQVCLGGKADPRFVTITNIYSFFPDGIF